MNQSFTPSNKDIKLATLILGFHPNHLATQPHNIIVDEFERREDGIQESPEVKGTSKILIGFHVGNPNSLRTPDNSRAQSFNTEEFNNCINEIMQFLNIEGTYEKEGDGAELYNLIDNPTRNMNWVNKKILEFRKKGHCILKANKQEEILDSDVGQAALQEYHKVLKGIEKDLRVETYGGQHRSTCHYMKYILHGETDDISIRFFYQFGDREEYEGKFVMKDHRTKNYIVLNSRVALHLISTMTLQDQYRVISFPDRNKYIKLVVRGYFEDGERIGKGDRTVTLDSEKNTGQGSSPKMLKRVKQKEKDLKAPEELKIAKEEIKELRKEIKSLKIDADAPVQDYIKAYHASVKRNSKPEEKAILSSASEYHEGIDITLDDIIDPKTQEMLEVLCADKLPNPLKVLGELKNYQSIGNKQEINGFIQMHLFGMTNENNAVSLVRDELNIRITYSEIQEILVRGSVLPK